MIDRRRPINPAPSGDPTPEQLIACFDAVARQGVNGIGALRLLLGELFGDRPVAYSALAVATAELLAAGSVSGFV